MCLESIRAKREIQRNKERELARKTGDQYAKELNNNFIGKGYDADALNHIMLLHIYGELKVLQELLK